MQSPIPASSSKKSRKEKKKAYEGSVVILSIINMARNHSNNTTSPLFKNQKKTLFTFVTDKAYHDSAEQDLFVWKFYHQHVTDTEMKLKLVENCQKSEQDRFFASANMKLFYISKKTCECVDDVQTLPIEVVRTSSKFSKRLFQVKFPMAKKGKLTLKGTAIELEKQIKDQFPQKAWKSSSKKSKKYVYLHYFHASPKNNRHVNEEDDHILPENWSTSTWDSPQLLKYNEATKIKKKQEARREKKQKKIYGDLGSITLSPSSSSE